MWQANHKLTLHEEKGEVKKVNEKKPTAGPNHSINVPVM
jgi:hypothetical protein